MIKFIKENKWLFIIGGVVILYLLFVKDPTYNVEDELRKERIEKLLEDNKKLKEELKTSGSYRDSLRFKNDSLSTVVLKKDGVIVELEESLKSIEGKYKALSNDSLRLLMIETARNYEK